MAIENALIGAAGEHLVLSRLLSRGILASLSPRNAYKADILVNPTDGGKPLLIQVKARTGKGPTKRWTMKSKHEAMTDSNLFYCFVDLSEEHPSVYVIPAKVVASLVLVGLILPYIAVAARRMHDVGKSGWFMLIPFYDLILALTPSLPTSESNTEG